MSTDDELPLDAAAWTQASTRAFLTAYPLPTDFRWRDRDGVTRAVLPTYALKGGYGKWLQETPYFPGLFEECHDLLLRAPADVAISGEWLAAELLKRRAPEPLALPLL